MKNFKTYFFILLLMLLVGSGTGYGAPAELFGTTLIADIAERVSPAVVAIESVHYIHRRVNRGTGDPFFDSLFGYLFEEDFRGHNNVIPKKGSGSGVIISPDGHLLTNEHVITGADEIMVRISSKETLKARVIGQDPQSDLAVLKVDYSKPLPHIAIGDSNKNRVGEWVVAVGNPFGLGITVTAGVISAINRDISSERDRSFRDLIQTDAAINPGNSGGALVNSKGELVGINTAIIPYGQGVGFAIPINRAKRIVGDLIEFGRVKKTFVGLGVQEVTPDLASYFKLKSEGVLVTEVRKGSAASEAKLVPGDLIVEIDGQAIHSELEFQKKLEDYRVNDKATFTIERKGKRGSTEVRFKEDPLSKNVLGIMVEDCSGTNIQRYGLAVDRGAVIVGVAKGLPAHRAGLQPGDVIIQVNNEVVLKESDFTSAMARIQGEPQAIVRVVRNRHSSLLLLNLQ